MPRSSRVSSCAVVFSKRTAIGIVAAGVAAVSSAAPASAVDVTQYIEVSDCDQPQTQWCTPIPSVDIFTVDDERSILVEFTASRNHCSDMIAHIIVDGDEWASNRVGPGESDGGYEIPVTPGPHTIGVQAEGIEGGCNTGYVASWGGTLRIAGNTTADGNTSTDGTTTTDRNTTPPATTRPPTATDETDENYDYDAALAQWMRDEAARIAAQSQQTATSTYTTTLEWVLGPYFDGEFVKGANRVIATQSDASGGSTTWISNEQGDAQNPQTFVTKTWLRDNYPQFAK